MNSLNLNSPSLRGLATVTLAFLLSENPSIIAWAATASGCICGPVPPNAPPIYPYLTLAHARHVQGYWAISFRCIECCLRRATTYPDYPEHFVENFPNIILVMIYLPCTRLRVVFEPVKILRPTQQMCFRLHYGDSELPLSDQPVSKPHKH